MTEVIIVIVALAWSAMMYIIGKENGEAKAINDRADVVNAVDRFEVIDHRECVWCRGRKLENRLVKGEYKEMPCSKCDGSGIMGGRVYTVSSNPERSIIAIDLSYQDNGKTLKVFVKDRG